MLRRPEPSRQQLQRGHGVARGGRRAARAEVPPGSHHSVRSGGHLRRTTSSSSSSSSTARFPGDGDGKPAPAAAMAALAATPTIPSLPPPHPPAHTPHARTHGRTHAAAGRPRCLLPPPAALLPLPPHGHGDAGGPGLARELARGCARNRDGCCTCGRTYFITLNVSCACASRRMHACCMRVVSISVHGHASVRCAAAAHAFAAATGGWALGPEILSVPREWPFRNRRAHVQ